MALTALHPPLSKGDQAPALLSRPSPQTGDAILWLQTIDASDLRLLIHTPRPNSDTVDKIKRLLADAAT